MWLLRSTAPPAEIHPLMALRAFLPHLTTLGVWALVLAACAGPRSRETVPAWPPLEPAELGEMHNVAVSDGIWIGSEPCVADLDLAYRRGIRRVISLCAAAECPEYDLRVACESLGMQCYQISPRDPAALDEEAVDRALALLAEAESSGIRTLMFSSDGSRCAAIFAIHRVVREDMPLEEALLEARRAGLRSGDEAVVRRHAERLLADREASS